MKLTVAQSQSLRTDDASAAGVLFYGLDAGLIRDSATKLVRRWCGPHDDPFRLCVLEREAHSRLMEEATSQSLLGGRRVIRLMDATDALLQPLKRLGEGSGMAYLVVEAPGLTNRSKLKAYAEAARDWAAVACYPSGGLALQSEIRKTLAMDRVKISDDAVQFIADGFGDDQAIRRAELETLALYAGPDGVVDLDVVQDCLAPGLDRGLEDALYAACAGDVERMDAVIVSLNNADVSGPGILANTNYFLIRLLRARQLTEGGLSPEAAMKAVSPPVFFQRQAAYGECIRLWPLPDLMDALGQVREADIACKRAGTADLVIAVRLLASLARQAAVRRISGRSRPS